MARILVIDDDAHIQELIRDVLVAAGHEVFVASDGREGLSRYWGEHPDLVITDIFMPERNGLDVILELAPTKVSIIAISGGGDLDHGDHLDDAINFGARWSLQKPFSVEALMKLVNEAIAA